MSFEQALKGAGMMLTAFCTGAAGAMAKYVDPDDVSYDVFGEPYIDISSVWCD